MKFGFNHLCLAPLCLAATFLANPYVAKVANAQEFTRSTIPLKSGGSMTSLQQQGQNVTYLNRQAPAPARTADARNAFNSGGSNIGFNTNSNTNSNSNANSNSNSILDRHEAGFAQSSTSAADRYPYPGSATGSNTGFRNGFNSQFTSAAPAADNSRTDFRFDRAGLGERPSGALGDTSGQAANTVPSLRLAQLPQPAAQLPQLPQLPNPAAALPAVPTFGGAQNFNLGPNYVNPAANFAGFQGFGAQPQAANTVPSLNLQFPQGSVGNNTAPRCCCVPRSNCCCTPTPTPQTNCNCATQVAAGAGNFNAFQFQQGIGTPQLNRTNNAFSSLLAGSGGLNSGSGGVNPLVQFRNNPPGTYLGQGLIGQPTAYVDGQPIRNLFRYVTP